MDARKWIPTLHLPVHSKNLLIKSTTNNLKLTAAHHRDQCFSPSFGVNELETAGS